VLHIKLKLSFLIVVLQIMYVSHNFFQCLNKIHPAHIKLPNGSLVTTSIAGTIVFNQHFYLNDVLYLPQFSFNLISVPKLTQSLSAN